MLPNNDDKKVHDNDDGHGDEMGTYSIYSRKLLRKHHAHTDDQWNSKISFSEQV